MIDVIIPAYNAHKTINQTLASIAYQSLSSKLNVYIIDDCSENNYQEFVSFYSNFINIKEIKTPKNGGPGLARQYGIDHSFSEYLIFIDSDDTFSNNHSIEILYNALVENNVDISMSGFLEETEAGFLYQVPLYVWMHGKMYRREFLKKRKIRFNDTRANEDCGFNHLCHICGAQYAELTATTYIWRNNKESITRVNSREFTLKYMKMYAYNMLWSIEEAMKREHNAQRLGEVIFGTIVSLYHYYLRNKELFLKENILPEIAVLSKYYMENPLTEETEVMIVKKQLESEKSEKNLIKVYNPEITLKEFIDILKCHNQREEVKND